MLQRTTSTTWIRGLIEALAARGIDTGALLRDAGIDRAVLDSESRRLPTDAVSELWRLAVERSGDAALAVDLAAVARPAQYGVVGYAMMSSPDLRAGIERLVRYLRLVSDAVLICIDAVPEGGRIRLDLAGGGRPVPRQRVEYALLMLLSLCRWTMGGALNPVFASFRFARPQDLLPYDKVLCCPVRFDAPCNSFTIRTQDLASPLPTAVSSLAPLHDRMARQDLERLEGPHIVWRVQDAVQRRLQDGAPLRAQIACDLHMSERTLQRRLAVERSSFEAVVERTRRSLAEQCLAEGQSSPVQLAFVLGYTDQRSLFRAFARWFGRTPGSFAERRAPAS